MKMSELLAQEFEAEMAATRAVVSRVPFDQPGYTVHTKSMSMIRLATHVAQLCSWAEMMMNTPEFDFSKVDPATFSYDAKSSDELVSMVEAAASKGAAALRAASDETLAGDWTLRSGAHVIFTMPRYMAFRRITMNHIIHHRGQLTVYLRLRDVPLPPTYGPSADEQMA